MQCLIISKLKYFTIFFYFSILLIKKHISNCNAVLFLQYVLPNIYLTPIEYTINIFPSVINFCVRVSCTAINLLNYFMRKKAEKSRKFCIDLEKELKEQVYILLTCTQGNPLLPSQSGARDDHTYIRRYLVCAG